MPVSGCAVSGCACPGPDPRVPRARAAPARARGAQELTKNVVCRDVGAYRSREVAAKGRCLQETAFRRVTQATSVSVRGQSSFKTLEPGLKRRCTSEMHQNIVTVAQEMNKDRQQFHWLRGKISLWKVNPDDKRG